MSETDQPVDDTVTTTDTKDKDEVRKPPKYHVVIHNDDYTPLDFVIRLLQHVFNYSYSKSTDIAMDVHEKGKGIAGTYPFDIAESKAAQIVQNAQRNGHPLLADVEEAPDDE